MPEKGFPGGSVVKNLLQYGRNEFTRGLGRSLEKEMATHSSIPAWRIPWTEEPGGLQSKGWQELDPTEQLNHHQLCFYTSIPPTGFYLN